MRSHEASPARVDGVQRTGLLHHLSLGLTDGLLLLNGQLGVTDHLVHHVELQGNVLPNDSLQDELEVRPGLEDLVQPVLVEMEDGGRSLLHLDLHLVVLQLRVLPPGFPLDGLYGLVGLDLVKPPAGRGDGEPAGEEEREARADPPALLAPGPPDLLHQLQPRQENFTKLSRLQSHGLPAVF